MVSVQLISVFQQMLMHAGTSGGLSPPKGLWHRTRCCKISIHSDIRPS